MIVLKKQQNIVLAQKPGDKKWKPGDREITIKTGSLLAKLGELTGMILYTILGSHINICASYLHIH